MTDNLRKTKGVTAMSSACEYQNLEFKIRTRITEFGETEKKICIEIDGDEVMSADSLEGVIKWFDYEQM